jgi:hypothetical protein
MSGVRFKPGRCWEDSRYGHAHHDWFEWPYVKLGSSLLGVPSSTHSNEHIGFPLTTSSSYVVWLWSGRDSTHYWSIVSEKILYFAPTSYMSTITEFNAAHLGGKPTHRRADYEILYRSIRSCLVALAIGGKCPLNVASWLRNAFTTVLWLMQFYQAYDSTAINLKNTKRCIDPPTTPLCLRNCSLKIGPYVDQKSTADIILDTTYKIVYDRRMPCGPGVAVVAHWRAIEWPRAASSLLRGGCKYQLWCVTHSIRVILTWRPVGLKTKLARRSYRKTHRLDFVSNSELCGIVWSLCWRECLGETSSRITKKAHVASLRIHNK